MCGLYKIINVSSPCISSYFIFHNPHILWRANLSLTTPIQASFVCDSQLCKSLKNKTAQDTLLTQPFAYSLSFSFYICHQLFILLTFLLPNPSLLPVYMYFLPLTVILAAPLRPVMYPPRFVVNTLCLQFSLFLLPFTSVFIRPFLPRSPLVTTSVPPSAPFLHSLVPI